MAWHNYTIEFKLDDETQKRTGNSTLEAKEYEALVRHQIANGSFGVPKDKKVSLVSVSEVKAERATAPKATHASTTAFDSK